MLTEMFMKAKKIAKITGTVIIIYFASIGLHKKFIDNQFKSAQKKVSKIEASRSYDKELLFYKNGGEPLYLVNKNYKKTIFFFEGFRTQSTAGMYADWFKKLHEEKKINIIVPVYGLQSSPFNYRNREWDFHEDMRLVVQVYDAYTVNLPEDHKVFIISQSFGTIVNGAIAVKGKRKADRLIFLSPLNTGMEYKVAGPVVYWLSTQTSWLRKVILFTYPTPPPSRATVWDIVNKDKNIEMANKTDINPEDSSELGYRCELAAKWMEQNLIPQVSGYEILVAWGDSDLYFSQKGFEDFSSTLKSNNKVKTITLNNSGHMVLIDNGEEKLKKEILNFLK